MKPISHKPTLILLCLMFTVGACNVPSPSPETAPSTENMPVTVPTATNKPEPIPTPIIVDNSLTIPEIASIITEIIYEQNQRATLGGKDTFFWPDGNIGVIPSDELFRFFAANSTRSAIMIGSLDNPGATVETNRMTIEGIDSQFSYAAGGPIYQDPESGLLLMVYHAERHFGGDGLIFHAAIGLAASQDDGKTFQNLGIILETNAPPGSNAPCCADMGGATYTVKDGQFLVYFRDRLEDMNSIELAVATAPVKDVIEAAKNGTISPWFKYFNDDHEPGISGLSSALEVGNPPTDWFSVSYNTFIKRYVMAISTHVRSDINNYQLYLATSEDGYLWSPRVLLLEYNGELTYPTIINPDGDSLNTAETFYIYYVTTPPGVTRWHDTNLQRMTVTLSGQMLELPHEWEFRIDSEGWKPLHHIGVFEVRDDALIIETKGQDPYMTSPSLGLSGDAYKHIEVRMKVGKSGAGQFFFTTLDAPYISEDSSVRFPIEATDDFEIYTVDMSDSNAWQGPIGSLRFDPIDQKTTVEIDYIRLVP